MHDSSVDIVLIGSGIMSATLGTYLSILEPSWTIVMYERLSGTAKESSSCWNNSGTGHAAFCEMNYTNIDKDKNLNISRAITICESFEISLQFWASLVKRKILSDPKTFINNIPHISFVCGEDNVNFLRKRFDILQNNTLFYGMDYSEDPKQIYDWIPLIMNNRSSYQKIAATRMKIGTDVDFGRITKQLIISLQKCPQFSLYLRHDVVSIKRNMDQTWSILVVNTNNERKVVETVRTRYVFVGCGGKSLILTQKSNIQEINRYAGFPIGGQFLLTNNPKIINNHHAKVYGKALIDEIPMSTPHIDARIIEGKKFVFFGPFAMFNTKFLKYGSFLDFFNSITKKNFLPMIYSGFNNFKLIKYLFSQLLMSNHDKFTVLRKYYPEAEIKDWSIIKAGQRVQIIQSDKEKGGILKFGTEIVSSSDGSLVTVLGASPGASASASIILSVLNYMFKRKMLSNEWTYKISEIIPSYQQKINGNILLTNEIRRYTSELLELNFFEI